MIPLRLTLRNFLSYRQATLAFDGLHVACVCGANGAGKSSLLEAIAWAVWGQSRASSEDNIIHLGETEARVDFTFRCRDQTYRIIRSRYRRQASALEFQVETPEGFRVLTGRGMRATQALIHQHIRLDYDTFVNSAYLRQGRADEFMLKRPSDRKRILADLLKLAEYDQLAERARERARQRRAEGTALEQTIARLAEALAMRHTVAQQQAEAQARRQQLQDSLEAVTQAIQQQQEQIQQRSAWQQAQQLQRQAQQRLQADCERLLAEQRRVQQQQAEYQAVLAEAEAIAAHYAQYQALQAEDAAQSQRMAAHRAARQECQELEQQRAEVMRTLTERLQRTEAQVETLTQQHDELGPILAKAERIAEAQGQLTAARAKLTQLDQRQLDADPLLQQQQRLQAQVDQQRVRLMTRLEELQQALTQAEQQAQQSDSHQQAIHQAQQHIQHLQQRRTYKEQVRERGLERRRFMDRLQARQVDIEQQLEILEQKMSLLNPVAVDPTDLSSPLPRVAPAVESPVLQGHPTSSGGHTLSHGAAPKSPEAHVACPLCDRPLDGPHRARVSAQYQQEQQDLQQQLWTTREQLAAAEREIQIMRQEYRQIEQELTDYDAVMEHNGQLKARFQSAAQAATQLGALQQEQQHLQQQLQDQTYGGDWREELQDIAQRLQQISYDERSHALARGEVDRWRWADVKQAELQQAQKQQQRLAAQRQTLIDQAVALTAALAAVAQSELQQAIDHLNQELTAIAYDSDHHTAVRQQLTQAQGWLLRHQALQQAQKQMPELAARQQTLSINRQERTAALQAAQQEVARLQTAIDAVDADPETLLALQRQQQELTQARDQQLAQIGRLEQQQQQLAQQQQRYDAAIAQQQQLKHQVWLHEELTHAFGRNGIQALIIETVLPQLEADANRILGRLSANQLHLQFVTQRASKTKTRGQTKLIDTLDILIADTQGTRPYETYSGGEAFRVNFAIRLAIARLLAQRAGTPLQLLVIDEGFGTQDAAGCDRLISAINAIAADFACVLTVTHIPYLREAFQSRIEVVKTEAGSQLQLVT